MSEFGQVCTHCLLMSPVSLVFHTIVTVRLISKMYLEQTHLFYNIRYPCSNRKALTLVSTFTGCSTRLVMVSILDQRPEPYPHIWRADLGMLKILLNPNFPCHEYQIHLNIFVSCSVQLNHGTTKYDRICTLSSRS